MDTILPGPWGATLELITNLLGALFFVFLPFEIWRRSRSGKLTKQSVLEMLASVSPLLPTLLTGSLVLSFIGALYGYVAQYAWIAIPTNGWTVLLAILVVDFLYYWDHRCAHVHPFATRLRRRRAHP